MRTTRSVKKKSFNQSSEELKSRIVTVFGKFGCLMGGNSTGPGFKLAGALFVPKSIFKRVQARFIDTQGPNITDYIWKTCLNLFLCYWIWKGRKNEQMELQWTGLWKRQQPQGSPELEKEHTDCKWIDWGSSHCIVKEAALKNWPNQICLGSFLEDNHPQLSNCWDPV